MIIDKDKIKKKVIESLITHIFDNTINENIAHYSDLDFYHIVTLEMAHKMSEVTGENFSDCIGRCAFISFLGKPISQDDFINLSDSDIPDGEELPVVVEFRPIGDYEHIIATHYHQLLDNCGGVRIGNIREIVCLSVMAEIEEMNKKHN